MKKTYLVNNHEGLYAYVIKAKNQEEAFEKFVEAHFPHDDYWLEECNHLHFSYYDDEHGDFYDGYTGKLREDIAKMENPKEYMAKHVEEGLSTLLEDYPEWVEHYMDYFNGKIESLSSDFVMIAYKAAMNPKNGYMWSDYSIHEVTYDEDGVFEVVL